MQEKRAIKEREAGMGMGMGMGKTATEITAEGHKGADSSWRARNRARISKQNEIQEM